MARKYKQLGELLMAHSTTSARGDLTDTISRIKEGVSAEVFEGLQRRLGVSRERLARVLRIAPRTLTRRLREGRFNTDESERLVRIERVYGAAVRLLGGEEDARAWMSEPNRALGETSPLDYADTEPGALEVERLIYRLEHGVFS